MLPLKVFAASGWNTTWKDALPCGPSVMGIPGLMTINSGRLLETCRIETACPPLLVTTTVAAELGVFTVTDPKLSEAGLTPTLAWIGVDRNNEFTKNNPRDRHTSRVLCMRGNPSCSVQVREQNGAEGISFANRDCYFQREDTTGGKVRFGTGVLWFSDWHALLLKEYDIVKLHFDVLPERRSVATLFFLLCHLCLPLPSQPAAVQSG